ncbi:unnamed protein product [Calypogeia fissa]
MVMDVRWARLDEQLRQSHHRGKQIECSYSSKVGSDLFFMDIRRMTEFKTLKQFEEIFAKSKCGGSVTCFETLDDPASTIRSNWCRRYPALEPFWAEFTF